MLDEKTRQALARAETAARNLTSSLERLPASLEQRLHPKPSHRLRNSILAVAGLATAGAGAVMWWLRRRNGQDGSWWEDSPPQSNGHAAPVPAPAPAKRTSREDPAEDAAIVFDVAGTAHPLALDDRDFQSFLGELRIVSPKLADETERAAQSGTRLSLSDEDARLVSVASQVLLRSDPENEQLAGLAAVASD